MFVAVDPREWVYMLHPRPVAIVIAGTWDEYSAMPASWIMPVSRNPPILAIAIARTRYTYELISRHREFAVCMLSAEHLKAIHFLGTVSGRDVKDKIVRAGLTKTRAKKIGTPIIGESLAVAECILVNDIEAGDHNVVLGRAVEIYKRSDIDFRDLERYFIPLHVSGNRYTYPQRTAITI